MGGQKRREHHPLISVDAPPQASEVESNFSKKLHTHLGEGPGTGQKGKRNKIIHQRETKALKDHPVQVI